MWNAVGLMSRVLFNKYHEYAWIEACVAFWKQHVWWQGERVWWIPSRKYELARRDNYRWASFLKVLNNNLVDNLLEKADHEREKSAIYFLIFLHISIRANFFLQFCPRPIPQSNFHWTHVAINTFRWIKSRNINIVHEW